MGAAPTTTERVGTARRPDLDDPGSDVSRVIRDRNGVQPRPEAGTGPSVFYLR